jgi:hypothetical protein
MWGGRTRPRRAPRPALPSALSKIALTALLFTAPASPAIVDRIAVAVGNKVITSSDIETRIRLTAFQNGEAPSLDAVSRKTAMQRLIDQRLVEREMELGHYPRLDAVERAKLVPAFATAGYKGSVEELDRALARARITRLDLEEDLARQTDLLTFLSLRFRLVVQGADADPKETAQKADQELEAWLTDQRKRTRIVIIEKELQ